MSSRPRAKQQFVIVKDVAASAERVFEALSSTVDMKAWVPMCRSASWQHPPGVTRPGLDSVRVFKLAGGIVAQERIVFWEAGRQLNYRFDPGTLPLEKVVRDYEGTTLVEPIGPDTSRLTWAVHFDSPGALALLEPFLRAGLRGFIGRLASRLIRVVQK